MNRETAYKDQVREDIYRELSERYGSGHKIAHAFGVKFQAVYQWKGKVPWNRMDQAVKILQSPYQILETRDPLSRSKARGATPP